MLHHKLEGIIIKIAAYKEYDRLITFFSPLDGIMRVIGKGVRRPGSQRSYHLDLFNKVDVELEASGKTSLLWYLREIHTREHYKNIKKEPWRFGCASIITLFVGRMVPEGAPHQAELYELMIQAFDALNTIENANPSATVFTFLIKAVKLLGYLEHTLKPTMLETELLAQLDDLDPQFTLQARRTLSIFSSL